MGNSPAVVFAHYRELCKPADGARWFSVAPTQADEKILQFNAQVA